MKRHFFYSRFLRKNDGSAIIEFAIVAPVFFLLFFGVTEFGLFMYHRITIERIAVEVSRISSIGKFSDSVCSGFTNRKDYITCVVKNKASALINGNKVQVQINTLVAGGTTTPDICLDDALNPTSAPATCIVYEDVNGSGTYNGSASSNLGTAGEVIEVRISYPWVVQFPLAGRFFGSAAHKGIAMITAATTIKNEPFN